MRLADCPESVQVPLDQGPGLFPGNADLCKVAVHLLQPRVVVSPSPVLRMMRIRLNLERMIPNWETGHVAEHRIFTFKDSFRDVSHGGFLKYLCVWNEIIPLVPQYHPQINCPEGVQSGPQFFGQCPGLAVIEQDREQQPLEDLTTFVLRDKCLERHTQKPSDDILPLANPWRRVMSSSYFTSEDTRLPR